MLDRPRPVGGLLRAWRQRRRLSQLELACDAGISTRHLSFVETGRASPSREMVLHLAEQLEVPIRERNVLLVAAGYAPVFPEQPVAAMGLQHTVAVPFRIRTAGGLLSFFSMTTVFGTPVDVILAELALELFFPADEETKAAVSASG
jgi:transcriptional regulator with XRE-family HTH domain